MLATILITIAATLAVEAVIAAAAILIYRSGTQNRLPPQVRTHTMYEDTSLGIAVDNPAELSSNRKKVSPRVQ